MGDPFTLVILVAAGGAADPTTYAIERASSQALGRSARVLVHESAATPTDSEALAAAPAAGPSAIVEVTWGEGHRAAVLRVHLTGTGVANEKWLDRTIGFGPNDADAERARTIGFALASMIPESDPNPAPPPAPSPAPSASIAVETATPTQAERAESSDAFAAARFALDMFAVGAAGLSAGVETAGGGGALEAFLLPSFALRFGGAVRAGSLTAARGSVLTLLGSAGIAIRPWRPTPARALGAALRLDYVIVSESLSHDSPAGPTASTRSRALSGADAIVEFDWLCAPSVEILLGAGVEEMFATTHIDLNGALAATLPPTSALAEAGLRLPF
jgi:hypothetical protein